MHLVVAAESAYPEPLWQSTLDIVDRILETIVVVCWENVPGVASIVGIRVVLDGPVGSLELAWKERSLR